MSTMDGFEKQDKMAEALLTNYRGKVVAITKATRAGATFSLLKKAVELKQKTVIVAPYKKIFDQTVDAVAEEFSPENKPKIIRIKANKDMCKKVKEKIATNPNLGTFPFHIRPKCSDCEYNNPNHCSIKELLTIDDWDIIAITYPKLKYILQGNSEIALKYVEKINSADNLILDEFTTGAITTAPSLKVKDLYENLQENFDVQQKAEDLENVIGDEGLFWAGFNEFAYPLNLFAKELSPGEHMVVKNDITDDLGNFFKRKATKSWSIIEDLCIKGKNTKILQDIMQIIATNKIIIYKKYKGSVVVQPLEDINDRAIRGYDFLKEFIKTYSVNNKLVTIVDACLPDLDLSSLLECNITDFNWGDPLETNKTQLIICDTKKINDYSFFRDSSGKIGSEIKLLTNLESKLEGKESIFLVTLNKSIHNTVNNWIQKGEIPDVFTTYYRSEYSRGLTVDSHHQSLILIGGPYIPHLAYLAETYGTDLKVAFRKSDMHSSFVNMIGRIKDPKGKQKSVVYALGITAEEIRKFVDQKNITPPLIVEFPVKGVDAVDFIMLAFLFRNSEKYCDNWINLERDLPLLVRILRLCEKKGAKIPVSEILKDKERAKQFVTSYSKTLEKFKINVVKIGSGLRLEANADLKDIFPFL